MDSQEESSQVWVTPTWQNCFKSIVGWSSGAVFPLDTVERSPFGSTRRILLVLAEDPGTACAVSSVLHSVRTLCTSQNWKAQGWRRRRGNQNRVSNFDLWEQVHDLLERKNLKVVWSMIKPKENDGLCSAAVREAPQPHNIPLSGRSLRTTRVSVKLSYSPPTTVGYL